MTKYHIAGVNPEDLDKVWGLFESGFESIRKKGLPIRDGIKQSILDKKIQAAIVYNEDLQVKATMTTEFPIRNGERFLNVVTLAGHGVDDWLDGLVDMLDQYADMNECKFIEACGRMGWAKKLAGDFEQVAVVMRRNRDV